MKVIAQEGLKTCILAQEGLKIDMLSNKLLLLITYYNLWFCSWEKLNLQLEYVLYFRHGMLSTARMQLFAQFLQVQTPSRGGRCRGENRIYAGYAYI